MNPSIDCDALNNYNVSFNTFHSIGISKMRESKESVSSVGLSELYSPDEGDPEVEYGSTKH
jgi:hypothetical protein